MWNFTVTGFTSVVEYDPPATHWSKTENKKVPFDDGIINNLPADYHPADSATLSSHVLVRARIKEDLAALKTYDPDAIETEDKSADYQYRLVMRRAAYAQFMYDAVMTLDYNSHVKETIDKRAPRVAGGRYGALSQIWSACARWQPNMPWGNKVSYGGYGGSSYDSKTGVTTYPATNTQSKPATSYYDSALGKWITPSNPAVLAGGAAPKALPAGSAVKSEGVKDESEFPTVETLDRMLDGIDADNPWVEPEQPLEHIDLGETKEGLRISADATRNTMIAQVKDLVKATGLSCEIEAVVDELQDAFGTVDIDTVPSDILTEMIQGYESVSTILAAM